MANIALFYHSLENPGGIERVILHLTRIFTNQTDLCVLITETEVNVHKDAVSIPKYTINKTDPATRHQELRTILNKHNIDWLILHSPLNKYLANDTATAHSVGAKVVLNIHFSFQCPILFTEEADLYTKVLEYASIVDAVACVSALDKRYWESLGIQVFHVQNPVKITASSSENHAEGNIIVWAGRNAPQKRPSMAIKVIAEVAKEIKDVRLLMVGVGRDRKLISLCKKLGVENNVVLIDGVADVEPFYKKAKLHLLTSVTESFCLVIAEAKLHGLPTVMFEIPFLELIESKQGVIERPYGDVSGLAKEIIGLLLCPERLNNLSIEARKSMERFNDKSVLDSWHSLFNSSEGQIAEDVAIKEIVKAWNVHCQENLWKIKFCDAINKLSWGKFQRVVQVLHHIVYIPVINFKRKYL